jgi:hypothetical protein
MFYASFWKLGALVFTSKNKFDIFLVFGVMFEISTGLG